MILDQKEINTMVDDAKAILTYLRELIMNDWKNKDGYDVFLRMPDIQQTITRRAFISALDVAMEEIMTGLHSYDIRIEAWEAWANLFCLRRSLYREWVIGVKTPSLFAFDNERYEICKLSYIVALDMVIPRLENIKKIGKCAYKIEPVV